MNGVSQRHWSWRPIGECERRTAHQRKRSGRIVTSNKQRCDRQPFDFPPRRPIHQKARPQQRWKRMRGVEPDVFGLRRKSLRVGEDRFGLRIRIAIQQTGGGGAVVRQRDRHTAWVADAHAGKLPARERQGGMAKCPVNLAAACLVMKHTMAVTDGQQRGSFRRRARYDRQGHRNTRHCGPEHAGREFGLQPRKSICLYWNRPVRRAAGAAVLAAVLRMERKDADVTNRHRVPAWYQHKHRIG